MPPRVMLAAPTSDELRRVLGDNAGRLPFIYLESDTRVILARLADYLKGALPASRWSVGRAFGAALEIRWRRDDLSLDAQALCEDESAPPGWTPSPWNTQLDAVVHPRNVLLAGVNALNLPPDHVLAQSAREADTGGLWVSESIVRPLYYPVSDPRAERVMLRCVDYLSGGMVVLSRLCDVVPYKA